MTLWAKLKELVDRVAGEDKPPRNLREEELRLAAAALLVRASVIDGKIDASERRKLKTLLQKRFELEGEEVRSHFRSRFASTRPQYRRVTRPLGLGRSFPREGNFGGARFRFPMSGPPSFERQVLEGEVKWGLATGSREAAQKLLIDARPKRFSW